MKKYAFRCVNCGWLESSGVAGECAHPHACAVCGHGVRFDTITGIKSLVPENWVVLNDADEKKLASWGLTKNDVEHHVPMAKTSPSQPPVHVKVSAQERTATKDVG